MTPKQNKMFPVRVALLQCPKCRAYGYDKRLSACLKCDYEGPLPKCDGRSQFCTGEDVRLVQIIGREHNQSYRGALRNWCKGCREMNNGGFRYP